MNKSYVSSHLTSQNNSPTRYRIKGREEVPKVNMRRTTGKKVAAKQDTTKCATIDIGAIGDSQFYTLKGQNCANGGFTYAYNAPSLADYDTPNYAHGTRLPEQSLIDSTGSYRFQAKVFCQEIQPNQQLYILGSIPELGNWQEYRQQLKWTQGDVWVSETLNSTVPHFCYKYVILENDEPIIWEQGYDRIADLGVNTEISKSNKEFIEK